MDVDLQFESDIQEQYELNSSRILRSCFERTARLGDLSTPIKRSGDGPNFEKE
jgi:hypothetical protein